MPDLGSDGHVVLPRAFEDMEAQPIRGQRSPFGERQCPTMTKSVNPSTLFLHHTHGAERGAGGMRSVGLQRHRHAALARSGRLPRLVAPRLHRRAATLQLSVADVEMNL